MSALSAQDVKDYLGIDFTDDATDRLISNMILTADAFMKGALGEHYPTSDERVKQVQKIIISDLYDHRDMSDKVSGATRRFVDSTLLQVKLEMRKSAGDNG